MLAMPLSALGPLSWDHCPGATALGLSWHLAAPWPPIPSLLHLSAMRMRWTARLQGLQEPSLPLTCQSLRAKAQFGATSMCLGTGRRDKSYQCKRLYLFLLLGVSTLFIHSIVPQVCPLGLGKVGGLHPWVELVPQCPH